MTDLTPERMNDFLDWCRRQAAAGGMLNSEDAEILLDALAAEKAARAAAESWKDIWRKEADDEEVRAIKAEQERDDLRARIEALADKHRTEYQKGRDLYDGQWISDFSYVVHGQVADELNALALSPTDPTKEER